LGQRPLSPFSAKISNQTVARLAAAATSSNNHDSGDDSMHVFLHDSVHRSLSAEATPHRLSKALAYATEGKGLSYSASYLQNPSKYTPIANVHNNNNNNNNNNNKHVTTITSPTTTDHHHRLDKGNGRHGGHGSSENGSVSMMLDDDHHHHHHPQQKDAMYKLTSRKDNIGEGKSIGVVRQHDNSSSVHAGTKKKLINSSTTEGLVQKPKSMFTGSGLGLRNDPHGLDRFQPQGSAKQILKKILSEFED